VTVENPPDLPRLAKGMIMKAAVYHSFGGPEVLEVVEAPEPKMNVDQVLIRVKAAALNPADLGFQAGAVDALVDSFFPVIPGWDVAGIVAEAGIGTTGFKPGDEVIGLIRGAIQRHGSYAERIAAEPRQLARKPANLDWGQAAGLPLAGLTAYQAVVHALDVREGETVLVHGAAGGVGHLAVQIAAARGASVIGTASELNHDYLRSVGVEPVAYGDGLADRVRALAPGGVEAVLDTAGRGALAITRRIGTADVRAATVANTNTPGPFGSSSTRTKPTWKPSSSWPKPESCRSA
jgi:NADPH:quinone reductase-like Zn-dependent oxidoreductase